MHTALARAATRARFRWTRVAAGATLLVAACQDPVRPPVAAPSTQPALARAAPPSSAPSWELEKPATAGEIEGYASAPSVNKGESISLYVRTKGPRYDLAVYRLGWHDGAGAALVAAPVQNIKSVAQPAPTVDAATGLVECRWTNPYELQTQASWTSGVYVAKLTAQSGQSSYILFVVRDDASPAKFLVQVSVNTYQAYNNWGGKSLYGYNSTDRRAAVKVSLNRPYGVGSQPGAARGVGAGEFLTNYVPANGTSAAAWEYNMVRFLERERYDVTYTTDYDVHRRPAELLEHRALIVMGHDEYWTMAQRNGIVAARDAGVHLGFFAANVGYWHVRFEPSMQNVPDRTMVGYKGAASQDPGTPATTLFRNLGLPENQLIGVMYGIDPVNSDVVIDDASTWVTAGTGLRTGDRLPGLLGYEIDWMTEKLNASMRRIGHSPYGGHHGDMTVYEAPNKTGGAPATVFATGTMQWAWGLDDYYAGALRPSRLSVPAQQITRNVLNRFRGTP